MHLMPPFILADAVERIVATQPIFRRMWNITVKRLTLCLVLAVFARCAPPNRDLEEQAQVALPESELVARVKQFGEVVLPGAPVEVSSNSRRASSPNAGVNPFFTYKNGKVPPEVIAHRKKVKSYWLQYEGAASQPKVSVEAATGTILNYYDHSVMGGGEADRAQDSNAPEPAVIPKERAFEIAKPLLEFFGQSLNIEEYSVEKEAGNVWQIHRRFSYNGTEFLGKVLSIQISASSGRVGMIYHRPIVEVPKTVPAPISKEEALKAATKSMKKNDYFKWRLFGSVSVDYDVKLDDISTVIALPESNRFMACREKSAIATLSPTEPRYCLGVPFMFTEKHPGHDVSGRYYIYVDMKTAQVIRCWP